jgi:phage portal protein BeeE
MRPNSEMTQAEFLGAWLASEEVCGEIFAEIDRDQRGRPEALWSLDPTCILSAHIAYPNSEMEGWIWRGYGEEVHLLSRDVFYTLRRDPQAPWLPLAALRVALGSIEADAMQTAFVRSFFRNSGVPSGAGID